MTRQSLGPTKIDFVRTPAKAQYDLSLFVCLLILRKSAQRLDERRKRRKWKGFYKIAKFVTVLEEQEDFMAAYTKNSRQSFT